MTTAATIIVKLILDTRGFQKRVTEAKKAIEQLAEGDELAELPMEEQPEILIQMIKKDFRIA